MRHESGLVIFCSKFTLSRVVERWIQRSYRSFQVNSYFFCTYFLKTRWLLLTNFPQGGYSWNYSRKIDCTEYSFTKNRYSTIHSSLRQPWTILWLAQFSLNFVDQCLMKYHCSVLTLLQRVEPIWVQTIIMQIILAQQAIHLLPNQLVLQLLVINSTNI